MTDLTLFPLGLLEPIDPTSGQVNRVPGIDAPCLCRQENCAWPWCDWKARQPDNEGDTT